jgi:Ca-activated chloride channel family protein
MSIRNLFSQSLGAWTLLLALSPAPVQALEWRDLWLTPDQEAQRLFDTGDYAAAADRFTDPMRSGVAWYRAGEFERAAAAFGQLVAAEAHYNRGNALLFQGAYAEAIVAYDQALVKRPDWGLAVENRKLALARKQRFAPAEDDAGGTGGKLGADGIVFDDSGRTDRAKAEQAVEGGAAGLTDAQLRELWLRRVETRPADFLRARFARQLQLQAQAKP